MEIDYKKNFCDNILECSVLKLNSNRLNHVTPNIPFEEYYLYKKKQIDHLLDLKLCIIKQRKILIENKQEYLNNSSDELSNEKVKNEKKQDWNKNKECEEIKTVIAHEQSVYTILRQWVERVFPHDNTKSNDATRDQKKTVTSFVIIGEHRHSKLKCFYEEYKIEITDYDIKRNGFFVQIHVNKNHSKIMLLSNKECVLIKKKIEGNTHLLKGVPILRNNIFSILKNRRIIKGEWYNKAKDVISLLTYEQVPFNEGKKGPEYLSVFRLINISGKMSEEVKIILPDMISLQIKMNNTEQNELEEDTEYDEMKSASTKENIKNGYEKQQQGNEFVPNRVLFMKRCHYVEEEVEKEKNQSRIVSEEKKSCNFSNIGLSDLSKNITYPNPIMIEKNEYDNFVVDFCFGTANENVVWLECCVFFLYKNGTILIYLPIFPKKCYISYYLLYEINKIREGKKKGFDYSKIFLQYVNYFENCSIINYRMNYVYLKCEKIKKKDFMYVPYVINALKPSCYTSINVIHYNSVVFLSACERYGNIIFLFFSYFITPLLSGKNEKPLRCKSRFCYNFLENDKNVQLNQINLCEFAKVINREKYKAYFNYVENKHKLNRIVDKIRGANVIRFNEYKKKSIDDEVKLFVSEDLKKGANISHNRNGIKNKMVYGEHMQLLNGQKKSKKEDMITKNVVKERKERSSNELMNGHVLSYQEEQELEREQEQLFYSCYEYHEELIQKEMEVIETLKIFVLPTIVFDSYYSGIYNVRSVVLDNNSLLCFNNDEVKVIHLNWLQFVEGIFFLLYKKSYILAKLLYDFCVSKLYMVTEIYKARIKFYDFNFLKYLKLDYCKISSYEKFLKLFKEKQILKNYKEESFDVYQSRVLYDVEYILYPLLLEDNEHFMMEKKSSDVNFLFTHYINIESQRRENLFMKKYVNYLTRAINKSTFLIYDCFKMTLSDSLMNESVAANVDCDKSLNGCDGKETYDAGEIVLIKEKHLNSFCMFSKESNLRSFLIKGVTHIDEKNKNELYKNMFSDYLHSIFNSYARYMRKKAEEFYIYKNFSICQNRKYLEREREKFSDNKIGSDDKEKNSIIEEELAEKRKLLGVEFMNKIIAHKKEKEKINRERLISDISEVINIENKSSDEGYELFETYKIHGKIKGKKKEKNDSEKMKGKKKTKKRHKKKEKTKRNEKEILLNYIDIERIDADQNVENHPYYHFIQLLKKTFDVIDEKNCKKMSDGKFSHKENYACKVGDKTNSFTHVDTTTDMKILKNNEINYKTVINKIKERVLNTCNFRKEKLAPCEELIKKLIKIKYDYNDVKDYYLRTNKMRLNFSSNDNNQMKMLRNLLETYYFFLDLNAHYEKRFEKTEKEIYFLLAYKIIYLLKNMLKYKNINKTVDERNFSIIQNIYVCFKNQKLISEKFTSVLVKKMKCLNQAECLNILRIEDVRTRYEKATVQFYNFLLMLKNSKNGYA